MQHITDAVHELARDSRGEYDKSRLEHIIGEAMVLMMEHFWDSIEEFPMEADFDVEEFHVEGEPSDKRYH